MESGSITIYGLMGKHRRCWPFCFDVSAYSGWHTCAGHVGMRTLHF